MSITRKEIELTLGDPINIDLRRNKAQGK